MYIQRMDFGHEMSQNMLHHADILHVIYFIFCMKLKICNEVVMAVVLFYEQMYIYMLSNLFYKEIFFILCSAKWTADFQ